jgi:uncharacterized protein
MAIDRRKFLQGLTGAAAFAACPVRAAPSAQRYMGCRLKGQESGSAAAFDLGGRELFAIDLPARGHDIAQRPHSNEAVILARRPGTWFVVVDTEGGAIVTQQTAAEYRHYYGHGAYSANGRLLYATENDTSGGHGVIGVYDATDGYRRIGEFPSFGIGPHDIGLLGDGRTLVIANGGLMTLPDSGREVLNPDTMRSTIDFIDPEHGELKATFELDASFRDLSLRHLALTPRGEILFGGQYQGDADDLPLLAGMISVDGHISPLPMPEEELAALQNYIGSVAVDRDGEILAATSPHGNRIAFWNVATGAFVGSRRMGDVCGIAPAPEPQGFVVSSGNEGCAVLHLHATAVSKSSVATAPLAALPPQVWDNHLVALP